MQILNLVARGGLSPKEASAKLRFAPFEQLAEGVTIDQHRAMRTGLKETVFAQGKSPAQLVAALKGVASPAGGPQNSPALATRVGPEQAELLLRTFPDGEYTPQAGLFTLNFPLNLKYPWPGKGEVMVITAGASDLRIGLEALGVAMFHGLSAGLAPDIGVCGIHRITPWLPILDEAKVLIVAAGMEGALPSVIAGLTRRPVLAVPVSVGYGVAAGGYAALLGMLSSCAPGVSVLNIDNGYGAAMFAARLLRGGD